MADKTVSVVLDPDDQEVLNRLCGIERLSQSDVIRRALRFYLEFLADRDSQPRARSK